MPLSTTDPSVGLVLGDTVRDIVKMLGTGKHTTAGDVGVEIEAEGSLTGQSGNFWNVIPDGSLRNNGLEYVMRKPVGFNSLATALDEFELITAQCKFAESPRTSCHVHYNVQTYTFKEIYAVIGAYWLFEDVLMQHCGPSRIGNLFCLRASDAQKLVTDVIGSVRGTMTSWNKRFILDFQQDYYKYAALNLSCLVKYGSLEFRGMRGIYKKNEISDWVGMLYHMIQKAKELGSPVAVYQIFKDASPNGLVEYFFGPYAPVIMAQKYWKDAIKNSSMFLAQLSFVVNEADKGKYSRPAYNLPRSKYAKPAYSLEDMAAQLTPGGVVYTPTVNTAGGGGGGTTLYSWGTMSNTPPPPPQPLSYACIVHEDSAQTLVIEGETAQASSFFVSSHNDDLASQEY